MFEGIIVANWMAGLFPLSALGRAGVSCGTEEVVTGPAAPRVLVVPALVARGHVFACAALLPLAVEVVVSERGVRHGVCERFVR